MAKKKITEESPANDAPADLDSLKLELDDAAEQNAEQDAAPESPIVGVDEPALTPSVVHLAKQRGYEVDDDATDDDFWTRVETLEEKAERLDASQAELEQLRQWKAQIEAERAAQKPDAAATKEQEQVKDDDLGIPDRPELDDFTHQVLLVAKAAGKLTEGPGGILTSDDQSLRPQLDVFNKHLAEVRAYDRQWGDPRKVAAHIYERHAAKEREEREALRKEIEALKSAQQTDKVQAEIDAYFARHKEAYFDLGEDGEPVWNGQTYVGEGYARYMAAVQEAMELGVTDRAAIHKYAMKHAPPQPAPQNDPPKQKVSKFINRLKTNGKSALPTNPVSRPAAGIGTRKFDGNINKHLDATFDALMNEQVAERI